MATTEQSAWRREVLRFIEKGVPHTTRKKYARRSGLETPGFTGFEA
jgi:hypothetical protein